MKTKLKGKRVLVTAGSDGIGKVIAKTFYDNGALVHICSRGEKKLKECVDEMPGMEYTVADVGKYDDVKKVFENIRSSLGGLDFLINNAGISGPTGYVDEIEVEEWRSTLAVNIDSQFYCSKLAVPMLKEAGGGCIVNIGSTASLFAYPLRAAYAASKWAVIGFTKTLAWELGEFKIRANAICPGCVEGPRIDGVIEREAKALNITPDEARDGYLRQTALRTFMKAQDVADMTVYLCSDAGARISGQAIALDGFTENCHS